MTMNLLKLTSASVTMQPFMAITALGLNVSNWNPKASDTRIVVSESSADFLPEEC
jgi:hypothetical protein